LLFEAKPICNVVCPYVSTKPKCVYVTFARKHKSVRVYIFRKQITKSNQMIWQGGGGSLRSEVRDISPTPLLFDY